MGYFLNIRVTVTSSRGLLLRGVNKLVSNSIQNLVACLLWRLNFVVWRVVFSVALFYSIFILIYIYLFIYLDCYLYFRFRHVDRTPAVCKSGRIYFQSTSFGKETRKVVTDEANLGVRYAGFLSHRSLQTRAEWCSVHVLEDFSIMSVSQTDK